MFLAIGLAPVKKDSDNKAVSPSLTVGELNDIAAIILR